MMHIWFSHLVTELGHGSAAVDVSQVLADVMRPNLRHDY